MGTSSEALCACGTQGGGTPLHDAAMNGHKEVVALLLQSGADTSAKNNVSLVGLPCWVLGSRVGGSTLQPGTHACSPTSV